MHGQLKERENEKEGMEGNVVLELSFKHSEQYKHEKEVYLKKGIREENCIISSTIAYTRRGGRIIESRGDGGYQENTDHRINYSGFTWAHSD